MARPSKYSKKMIEEILERIREGESERSIGKDPLMPDSSTISRWKDQYPEFCKQSVRAREESAETFNDELLELKAELKQELAKRLANGEDFPKGVIEAYKVLMQECARQAAIRDDSRFGDRKTVKLDATEEGKGMAEVYARMLEAQKDD